MNYDIIADRIEVRGSEENNKPRYVVKAHALAANKKDIYQYIKQPDGSYRTLKSMFTPNCIKSIKEQSKHKRLFIDIQHGLARDESIKSIIKGKVTPEEEKQINNMLDREKLPLAKLNDIEINDDRIDIDTELNPMFREVNDDHRNYFDAVWYSLQHKYLNGVSINFANPKIIKNDNDETVIDDIDILGFSYLDAPAHHENSIYEVAIRAMEEGISIRGSEKMEEEEKKKFEIEKAKLEDERKQIEKERAELQKQKEDTQKQVEIRKQEEEQNKIKEELAKKTEEARKAQEDAKKVQDELNSIKGQMKTGQDKYGQQGKPDYKNPEFYKENLKKITAAHDETIATRKSGKQPMIDKRMSGFGELVNLSAQANNPTADLSNEDAEFIRQNKLLGRGGEDIVTPRLKE